VEKHDLGLIFEEVCPVHSQRPKRSLSRGDRNMLATNVKNYIIDIAMAIPSLNLNL
jgi:hypothetical protein